MTTHRRLSLEILQVRSREDGMKVGQVVLKLQITDKVISNQCYMDIPWLKGQTTKAHTLLSNWIFAKFG